MAFSIRLTEEERELASAYAKLHAISLGDAFKTALFERIQDEYDATVAAEALAEYQADGNRSRPVGELWNECGL